MQQTVPHIRRRLGKNSIPIMRFGCASVWTGHCSAANADRPFKAIHQPGSQGVLTQHTGFATIAHGHGTHHIVPQAGPLAGHSGLAASRPTACCLVHDPIRGPACFLRYVGVVFICGLNEIVR